MPNEDSLRYKYTPLPDEPRFKKKRKKVHVKSDHKHVYKDVAISITGYKRPFIYIGQRCSTCGRLFNCEHTNLTEPPVGMSLYELADFSALLNTKVLSDEMKVC